MITRRVPMQRPPMKRSGTGLKRSRLKPVSAKKAEWKRQYLAEKLRRMALTRRCERCRTLPPRDGHHPKGQHGENIMEFYLLCRPCHDWIHTHPNEAREDGWLVA